MKQQRNSRQRQMILDAVQTRCDHPTADQIYLDVRGKDERISRGTVYRNLGILSEDGAITNVKVPAADRFDSRLDLHYHLFCTGCGRVFDAPLSYRAEFDAQVAAETGFQVSRHRVIFEGLCPECVKEKNNLI
ncbi:MAG: Fur family transcriptional regulator [Candidatus Onthomonas sp.]